MTLAELTAAERHRRIAADFTAHVEQVVDWEASTPVAGWQARDVVEHLVTWLPGLLSSAGVGFPSVEAPTADPVAVWMEHTEHVQALLDDDERAAAPFSHPHAGAMPAGTAVDRLYTSDVFMHTWDLARAGDRDVELEPEFCTMLLAGMEPIQEMMRASGQYGPAIDVPADADPQTRLVGFIGRDPSWRPEPTRREASS